jgi:hypothetical protein
MTRSEFVFRHGNDFHERPLLADLQGRVPVDRDDETFKPAFLSINVVAATDPGQLPPFLFRELCQALAADRFHTATSSKRPEGPGIGGKQPGFDRLVEVPFQLGESFALRDAAGKCRDFRPIAAFLGLVDDRVQFGGRSLLPRRVSAIFRRTTHGSTKFFDWLRKRFGLS